MKQLLISFLLLFLFNNGFGQLIISSIPIESVLEDDVYTYKIETSGATGAVGLFGDQFPTWLSFTDNADGSAILTGTPLQADIGVHYITIRAVDDLTSILQDFKIEVIAVNDPPIANNDVATVNEGESIIIDLAGNDFDEENQLDATSIVFTSPC